MARFWTIGTSPRGSSTPRFATGHNDGVERVDDLGQVSTALGFSIFAATGTRWPSSSMIVHAADLGCAGDEGQCHEVDGVAPRDLLGVFMTAT